MLLKSIAICSLRRLLPLPGDRFLTANLPQGSALLPRGQVPDTLLYYIILIIPNESSFLRREERSKEALPLPRPSCVPLVASGKAERPQGKDAKSGFGKTANPSYFFGRPGLRPLLLSVIGTGPCHLVSECKPQ